MMLRQTLQALNKAIAEGRAIVRATDLKSGDERLIDPATDKSALGIQAGSSARADQSNTVVVEGRSWFLAVYNPPLDLAIVGAVHIAQPLASIASVAGYKVRVIDPRTAFASTERFPRVALSHDWPDEALAKAPLGPRSALVALTHDPKLDDPALRAAFASPCFYIGALGSKKTHAGRLERLRADGVDETSLARIHGPIGLAIGAKSPAEIAVSIIAEMTRELRAGPVEPEPARASLRMS